MNDYYIMGSSRLGRFIKNYLSEKNIGTFLGFLDNKLKGDTIYNPETIANKNAVVIIGSINYMYEMKQQLINLGYKNIITFAQLILKYPELQNYNQAFDGLREDYENNKEKYEQLRNILADEKSKEVLDTIIEFRETLNIDLYSKIREDINKQYFEDFMPKNTEIYVDGGAFDGDTVKRALKYINPLKIYFFEPDETSLNKAKNSLKNLNNINYYPFGLSDKQKTLKFDAKGDFGSCFSNNGNVEIKCVSLDETIKEDKAFIKLDIEGAEIDALKGAERLLKNNSPFAVCVYHKPSDIWKIPELLLNVIYGKTLENCRGGGKKIFILRHYTNTVFETVLYGGFKT